MHILRSEVALQDVCLVLKVGKQLGDFIQYKPWHCQYIVIMIVLF